MKFKTLLLTFAVASAFLLPSCNSVMNPLSGKETPELFPIQQNDKWGFINRQGEIVIQPQFERSPCSEPSVFFSEGLAVASIGNSHKCGYIDETGKFVINPQFDNAYPFSEGLAAVIIERKIGFVDKTGKMVINPQFEIGGGNAIFWIYFSENLASVKIGDKYGFVDKEGKIVINPQFDNAYPFSEGLAAVSMGEKGGYVDKEGKIVINPQFDIAFPFINGLAVVKIGKQYGYIDKQGKIAINPQFDIAYPFSDEGLAWVGQIKNNEEHEVEYGFIDKEGKYTINPQFVIKGFSGLESFTQFLPNYHFKIFSFSEGLASIRVGAKWGYIDATGKIVINPQFVYASPFYGGLASVVTDSGMAYIDKEGKYVWRETKETQQTNTNVNRMNSNMMNTNMATPNDSMSNTMVNSNVAMSNGSMSNGSMSTSSSNQKTGQLVTDSNLRGEPNKNSASVGIHFKDAKVKILDETSYEVNGTVSIWYKVRVTDYGCSKDTSLGCGKNSPNDADEGWVNAKVVLLN